MKKLLSILVLLSVVAVTSAQKRVDSTANSIDLLITGGAVVTMDGERRVLDNGFVAIRGERILEVGTGSGYQAAVLAARAFPAASSRATRMRRSSKRSSSPRCR